MKTQFRTTVMAWAGCLLTLACAGVVGAQYMPPAGTQTRPQPQRQPPVTVIPPNTYPFQNPDLPLEERVNNIVSLMTLNEKIGFLTQSPSLPRLGIRTVGWAEGLHGIALGTPGNWCAQRSHSDHHVFAVHRPGRNLGYRHPAPGRGH